MSDVDFAVRQMRDAFQQMVPLPIVRDLWRRNMPPEERRLRCSLDSLPMCF